MSKSEMTILNLADKENPKSATIVDAKNGIDRGAVNEALSTRGFCIIRNLFPPAILDETERRANRYLQKPAIAGAPGYCKVDHPKVILDPFMLGGPILQILLNEEVIGLIEAFMGSECVLAETALKVDFPARYEYFPLHSDFAVGWAKSEKIIRKLTADDMQQVVAIGGAFYFHETHAGAFSYCDGTHNLLSPKGQRLSNYSAEEQTVIKNRRVRCDGVRGDLVLFDDRGFHGPDQPSTDERRVILLDYFRVDTIGRLQVSPVPIWSTDIADLSPIQLRVAGVGADFMVPPYEYSKARFQRNTFYPLLSWLVDKAYIKDHVRNTLKNFFR
ncbi:MAG: hypothetical protein CMM41_04865 [Rhodospirillaceae bacterium]|nr:hypothetical protein [Rhodospirillaceae bacterium]